MRYKYTITKEGGETEEMEAMSWKKLFMKENLFTNEKETRRAIKAAVDKYNEIYSNHTVVKHQRSRHTKSKTQTQRKLRRNR